MGRVITRDALGSSGYEISKKKFFKIDKTTGVLLIWLDIFW